MNRKFFDRICQMTLENTPECAELARFSDAEIAKALESYAETMNEDELDELRGKFADTVSSVMNEAYTTGAKHSLKLIIETITE